MLHFVDKTGNGRQKTNDFVLLSFSFDVRKELLFGISGQIPANRLNYKEDNLDVAVNVHLNLARILFKETIGLIVLKFLQFFLISLNDVCQLIQQVINVESFSDLSIN